jgi:hypothetical protein
VRCLQAFSEVPSSHLFLLQLLLYLRELPLEPFNTFRLLPLALGGCPRYIQFCLEVMDSPTFLFQDSCPSAHDCEHLLEIRSPCFDSSACSIRNSETLARDQLLPLENLYASIFIIR